jgi:hypothetical protein
VRVHQLTIIVATGLLGLGLLSTGGCADNPPVERVTVPAPGNRDAPRHEYEKPKPMPEQWRNAEPPPPPPADRQQ